MLADRIGARDELALELPHFPDDIARAAGKAHPEAGHRIGLGDAVDGECAREQLRGHIGHRGKRGVRVEQVLVDVVRHHMHMGVARQHFGKCCEVVRGIGGARGVGGRVEREPLRLWADGGFQVLRKQAKAVLLRAGNRHRHTAGQPHKVLVCAPEGRRQDHLVAGAERRQEGAGDRRLGPRRRQHLVGRVFEPVLAAELAPDRLLELGDAVAVGIADDTRRHRLFGCRAHMVRRREIGLPDGEVDDVDAVRCHGAGAH